MAELEDVTRLVESRWNTTSLYDAQLPGGIYVWHTDTDAPRRNLWSSGRQKRTARGPAAAAAAGVVSRLLGLLDARNEVLFPRRRERYSKRMFVCEGAAIVVAVMTGVVGGVVWGGTRIR